jgi:hypothetical protein
MINATNPSVSNSNLPPPSLDQEETSVATGANTNAAASTQSETAKPVTEQGITAEAYDANFSTTRDPSNVNSNQMLMINPNSVNPNATRANVQGQMETTPNRLMLGSSDNKLAYANSTSNANETASTRSSDTNAPMEIARAAKKSPVVDIKSVGNNSQSGSPHATDDYKFADRFDKDIPGTVGSQGCTITALTNVLGSTAAKSGLTAPSVRDTNSRNDTFFKTFDATKFKDLTGNDYKIERRAFPTDSIAGLSDKGGKMTPIATLAKTNTGELKATMLSEPKILKDIRNSLEDGKPVLLGLSKNADKDTRVTKDGDQWGRHTVVAKGINDKGQIMVVDSADGKTKTLQKTIETWGDNNVDMAFEVSRKPPSSSSVSTDTQTPLERKREGIESQQPSSFPPRPFQFN